jgi:hypothetical protein
MNTIWASWWLYWYSKLIIFVIIITYNLLLLVNIHFINICICIWLIFNIFIKGIRIFSEWISFIYNHIFIIHFIISITYIRWWYYIIKSIYNRILTIYLWYLIYHILTIKLILFAFNILILNNIFIVIILNIIILIIIIKTRYKFCITLRLIIIISFIITYFSVVFIFIINIIFTHIIYISWWWIK